VGGWSRLAHALMDVGLCCRPVRALAGIEMELCDAIMLLGRLAARNDGLWEVADS
jgi:hypothetical protein